MENIMRKTQVDTVLNFLKTGRPLTRRRARSWGIQNLSARIFELREDGYRIFTNKTRYKKTKEVVYNYRLAREFRNNPNVVVFSNGKTKTLG
jgi:hypothetical protein